MFYRNQIHEICFVDLFDKFIVLLIIYGWIIRLADYLQLQNWFYIQKKGSTVELRLSGLTAGTVPYLDSWLTMKNHNISLKNEK